jgi:hypothetical protein
LADPAFAARFKHAGEAWDVALQIAALRARMNEAKRLNGLNDLNGAIFLTGLVCGAPVILTRIAGDDLKSL